MVRTIGTASYGLRAPIIQEGDDLSEIVTDIVLNSGIEIKNKDVIGITESLVARSAGCYVTLDEVVEDIKRLSNNAEYISVYKPIYSRNRFAMILKAIARAAGKRVYIHMPSYDEVGNVVRNHPFTGLNYDEYYTSIVETEGKECVILRDLQTAQMDYDLVNAFIIDSRMYTSSHSDKERNIITLADICSDKCDYGLYGSNKSTEEMLKLFPSKKISMELVEQIQGKIYTETGKKISCFVFGDGAYRDPDSKIWEFADPVVCPAYTSDLEGTPNEIKIKNFADEKYKDLHGEELNVAIKKDIKEVSGDLKGNMSSQGTTPRRYVNLLGSLADLTTGSGSKGTPIVYIQGYFDSYADD